MNKFEIIRKAAEVLNYSRSELIDALRAGDVEIMTEAEATERVTNYITDTLWAFNLDFISNYMPDGVSAEILQPLLNADLCESLNPLFVALIGDRIESLVADAITSDGLGHFLSTYDGCDYEIGRQSDGEYLIAIRNN